MDFEAAKTITIVRHFRLIVGNEWQINDKAACKPIFKGLQAAFMLIKPLLYVNPEVLETTLALRATQWAFLRHTPPHRLKTNHSPKSPPVLNLQAACSVCAPEFVRL